MLNNPSLNIGSKLVLASIICIIPVMLFSGYYLYQKSSGILFDEINASQLNNLNFAVNQIQREIQHQQDTAEVIATDQVIRKALDTYDVMGINSRLNRIAAVYPNLNYIMLLDDQKSVLAVTTINGQKEKLSSEEILGETVINNPMSESIITDSSSYSAPKSDPFIEQFKLNQHYSQWFLSPVFAQGKLSGWVVLSYKFEPTITILLSELVNRLTSQGYPALSSQIGYGDNKIIAGGSSYQTNTIDQQISFPIGSKSFLINLRYDKEKALTQLDNLRNTMTFVFIALILFLMLGLYWSTKRILITPLKQLEQGALKLSSGNLNFRIVNSGQDEISQLAHTFNSMGESILQATENLEHEVSDRTRDANVLSDKLLAILDSTADAILTLDTNGNITSFNKAAENIFYYESQSIIGHHINKIIPHPTNESGDQFEEKSFKHIITSGSEVTASRSTGEQFPSFISTHVNETANDSIFTITARDITITKKAEQSLIDAKNAAENAAKAKSEFLASMSHEIRTPMNGVIGMLGLLSRDQLSSEQIRRVDLAQTSAKSLLNIINDILDFSKIEAGKLDIEEIDFNLNSLLEEFSDANAYRAQEKGLEFILDATQVQRPIICGDPGRIRQILTNLVSNAIKFTDHGEISIHAELHKLSKDAMELTCSISDTGIGINQTKINSIFESFTQADASTTRKYGGTGLGLTIVKNLCQLMGGDVSIANNEGDGATFTFRIIVKPCIQNQYTLPSVDLTGTPILVVDDNATNREVLHDQLSLWGAEVTLASNANECLVAINKKLTDGNTPLFKVAIIDMQMPGMDGAELGKIIRNNSQFDDTKLIMMTSLCNRGDATYFSEIGFSAYFPKPTTISDLYDALNLVIHGGDALQNAQPLVTHHYLKGLQRQHHAPPVSSELPTNCRVLLIEDNKINQVVALGILEDLEISCDTALNGAEAIAKLNSSKDPYHLIFMDCQMPVMDGYEATREIRKGAAGNSNSTTPIIAMTANAMKGDKEKCLEAGMNDYIAKPIDPIDIENKVRHWLITNRQ